MQPTRSMPAMFSSNTLVTGGTFVQNHDNRQIHTGKGNIDRLAEAVSPAAFHNSGDRHDPPKCHPNTRVAVLRKIKDWMLSLDPETQDALIMWLYGPAGSGKSAIAQSIAEWAFEEGLLFASYFFSRSDSTRNHPRSLIATIAYQAASYSSELRDGILTAIDADPLIFTRSLMTQILTIIIKPLHFLITSGYFNGPLSRRLIIIDGLDECGNHNEQMDILRTITKALQDHHLPLIFLVASRPEYDITNLFSLGYLREASSRLPLDDKYQPSSDIKLFLRAEFNEIKQNHPLKAQIPREWPAQETLEKLVRKSSGQFIYAATVMKFVKSTRHRPLHRLDIVLGLRPVVRGSDLPFSELDALYRHVLICVENLELVLQILAFQILRLREHDLSYMERVLSLNLGDIRLIFCDLHSIIDFQPVPHHKRPDLKLSKLHFFHASLQDFLLDKSRSKELYIDAPIRHAEFAQAIFPYLPHFVSAFDMQVCGHHLKLALPGEKLRQGILDLDVVGIFRLPTKDLQDTIWTVEGLLKSIKESQFVDAKSLYLHHSRAVDKYVAETLKTYYSEKGLTALIAVLSVCDEMPWGFTLANINDLFQLDEKARSIDLHGLKLIPLLTTNDFVRSVDYYQFLHKIFADKMRLGIYAPNATMCANSAILLLQRINHQLPRESTLVVKLLQKSGRSEELINFARIYPFAMLPGHERLSTKRAVVLYLARMDRGDA